MIFVMGGRRSCIARCALTVTLAGCGSGASPSSHADRRAPPQTAAQTVATTPQPKPDPRSALDRNGRVVRFAPNRWRKPRKASIRPHPGFGTKRVLIHDVKRGRGPAVRPHDYVFVDFIEANYVTGETFNGTWRQNPLGGVILATEERLRGLVIGMRGMRPGGRRTIIVPRNLSGIEPDHAEYRKIVYWDVVLRGYYARGCNPSAERCRSDRT